MLFRQPRNKLPLCNYLRFLEISNIIVWIYWSANCLLTLDRVFETSRRFGFSARSLGHVMFSFSETSQFYLRSRNVVKFQKHDPKSVNNSHFNIMNIGSNNTFFQVWIDFDENNCDRFEQCICVHACMSPNGWLFFSVTSATPPNTTTPAHPSDNTTTCPTSPSTHSRHCFLAPRWSTDNPMYSFLQTLPQYRCAIYDIVEYIVYGSKNQIDSNFFNLTYFGASLSKRMRRFDLLL